MYLFFAKVFVEVVLAEAIWLGGLGLLFGRAGLVSLVVVRDCCSGISCSVAWICFVRRGEYRCFSWLVSAGVFKGRAGAGGNIFF